jgi:hypothetical protein
MPKKKRSEGVSTGKQKRAKAEPESPSPSPGPSRPGYQQVEDVATEGFATAESVAMIEGDRTPMSPTPRALSPELLSALIHEMGYIRESEDDPAILTLIHHATEKVLENTPDIESLVSRKVFLQNVSRKQGSGFLDLAKKSARNKDWKDVILHGMVLALGMN